VSIQRLSTFKLSFWLFKVPLSFHFSNINSLTVSNFLITRRRSFAEYWKYFVAHLNDVHAFGYNFAGCERIWMKFGELQAYCLALSLTYLGAIRIESTAGDLAEVLFFLSGKQRTTLPISGQPNFTKFAQIRDSVTW